MIDSNDKTPLNPLWGGGGGGGGGGGELGGTTN